MGVEKNKQNLDTHLLYEGLVVKNYKEMCKLLNEEVCNGCSKKAQINNWKRYFNFVKIQGSQNITITKIYDNPLPVRDKRTERPEMDVNEYFKVDEKDKNKNGVYLIQCGNTVYVGSTTVGFRNRFMQHFRNYSKTYKLLHNSGIFSALWIDENNQGENVIREKEVYYINEYQKNKEYISLNVKDVIEYKKDKVKKNLLMPDLNIKITPELEKYKDVAVTKISIKMINKINNETLHHLIVKIDNKYVYFLNSDRDGLDSKSFIAPPEDSMAKLK